MSVTLRKTIFNNIEWLSWNLMNFFRFLTLHYFRLVPSKTLVCVPSLLSNLIDRGRQTGECLSLSPPLSSIFNAPLKESRFFDRRLLCSVLCARGKIQGGWLPARQSQRTRGLACSNVSTLVKGQHL